MSRKKSTALVIPQLTSVFLSAPEARALLRCSKRTIIRYYLGYTKSDGRRVRPILGFVRRGGRILFERTELTRFLTARTRIAA